MSSAYFEHKSVRDPLYGFVDLSEREFKILETGAMQRLARVKQLGHTYIVYPSAVHTRLEHSLGALYIAGRICDRLGITGEEKETIRATVLLHDIGHGPFSHVFEEVMRNVNGEDFSHEKVTKLLVEKDDHLKKALGSLWKNVSDLISAHDTVESEIISGSVDADKLDYLRRDSYHTGVYYGVFDLERIIRAVCKIPQPDREYLAVDEKGKDALENYRLARYSMHAQVYEHHTRLITDDMFVRGVVSCIKDGTLSKDYFDVKDSNFVKKHLELDDATIEEIVLQNGGTLGKDLIKRIRGRNLFKRAYFVPLTKEGIPNGIKRHDLENLEREQIATEEKRIAKAAGADPNYIIVHLQSTKIKLYERFEALKGGTEGSVLIRRRNRPPSYLNEESPIYTSTNQIRNLFVFCPEEYISKVKNVCENVFEAQSFLD